MKRLRNKMTTEELAECLGVAKQTVNRWIREKGWKTEIYGHSRFCNTDFDDKLACLNLSGV
ncbi:YfeC-like transcriptional regulator [Escherichia coli]|uniref:YfeC-like transcriptional regulator n=1 Tax=Escherichia coli TaxID=562 RepID=UPI00098CB321|nr:putative DNA-binding transcriptional regulator [Escherichia coli]NYS55082.1 putative DNA-binding transcriptional regulator [Escherichia coli]PSF48000.1 helix-turn-helix domain-containing protein [Escherichia coli]RCZ03154.1 helix-turn-helix domain-containing protein [Escherichia coli]RZX63153.1 putative DNA-binding transcriptional regulator [Escherichia coli]